MISSAIKFEIHHQLPREYGGGHMTKNLIPVKDYSIGEKFILGSTILKRLQTESFLNIFIVTLDILI